MNAKILLPLIQEYVKDPALTESEVSDIVQLAREMDVSADAVRALVAIDRYRVHHQPAQAEPIALIQSLIQALSTGTRLHKESLDFIYAQAQSIGVAYPVAENLVHLHQAIGNAAANPQRLMFRLMRSLAKSGPLSGERENFLRQRGAQVNLDLEIFNALLLIANEEERASGAKRYELYDQLIDALGVDKSLTTAAREFAHEMARELSISEDIAYALTDIYEQAGQDNPKANIPLLDALIKGFIRRGLTATNEREYLADQAYRLKLPVAGADALIRYELLVTSRQAEQAEQQLNTVKQILGLNGQASDGLTAYITQLEMQLDQIRGSQDWVKRIEESILEKRVQRGELKQTATVQVSQADFTRQETTHPTVATQTTTEEVVTYAAQSNVPRGLNDVLIYKINTDEFGVSKAQSYCHRAGFTWYMLLKDAKSNRPTPKLLILNGEEVDTANIGDLTFSRNGLLNAYKKKIDATEVAVLNGKSGERFDAVGALTFSNDEKHFAYLAKKGRGWHVVLDNNLGPASPALRDLHFNPVTSRLAFVNYNKGYWQVVHDGVEDKLYSAVGGITFSPDGQHLVYWAKKGNQYFALQDGKETAAFAGVGEFTFSRDSKQLAYMVNRDRLLAVVHNGRVSDNYDIIRKLSFSADGKHLGYMVKKNNREYTVIDGQPENIYDKVNGLIWSPSGSAYAYEATEGRDKMVVINGKPGKKFEQISGMVFNPTDTKLAYAGYRDGAWVVMYDGKESEAYSDVNEITFSPDGKHFTYFAKIRSEWSGVVRNGERLYEFAAPKYLCYSEDSSKIAFLHFKGRSWHFIINGDEVGNRTFDEVLQGPKFDLEKECFYLLAQSGKDLRQVTFG